jgi:hypothetical protein
MNQSLTKLEELEAKLEALRQAVIADKTTEKEISQLERKAMGKRIRAKNRSRVI